MIDHFKDNKLFYSFLLAYAVISFLTLGSYGSNQLEVFQIHYGDQILHKYFSFLFDVSPLDQAPMRHHFHHAAFWHTFQSAWESLFSITDLGSKILFRHYSNFFFFILIITAFYFLQLELKIKKEIALFVTGVLALYPRIYHHAIVNPSDIPTMGGFIFSYLTLFIHHNNSSRKNYYLHILASGFLIGGIKFFGLFILGASAISFYVLNGKISKNFVHKLFTYCLLSLVVAFLFSPTMWSSPIGGLFKSISLIKVYSWRSSRFHNLFWMFYTLPLYLVVAIIYSVINNGTYLFKHRRLIDMHKEVQLILWGLVPLLLPILLNIAGYDGWRHHYFILPAFLILISFSMTKINLENKTFKVIAGLVIFHLSFLNFSYFPFQGAYFNLITKMIFQESINQELLTSIGHEGAYKKAFEYAASNLYEGNQLTILANSFSAKANYWAMEKSLRSRVNVIGATDFPRSVRLKKNSCLSAFLKSYSEENEGAKYRYNDQTNSLEVWGLMLEFFRDKLVNCFEGVEPKQKIHSFFEKEQYYQTDKYYFEQLLRKKSFSINVLKNRRLKTIHSFDANGFPILYIQKVNPNVPLKF